MNIAPRASVAPRPRELPPLAVRPPVDFFRDTVELDGEGDRQLPQPIADFGIVLDIDTTARDDGGGRIDGWYASDSEYTPSYRMNREGFSAALRAAQLLSKGEDTPVVAVVQAAHGGARYIVPLGVWNPADQSEHDFREVGTPHWSGAKDHMLMRSRGSADVEAVVFGNGRQWLNFMGHPVKLPTEG